MTTIPETRRPGRTHSAYVRHPAGVPRPVDEWRIYRWWGYLPREAAWWRRLVSWLLGGWQQLLYIGQTGRMPHVRALEHALDKSWVAGALTLEIEPRVWHDEGEVLAYEAAAIRRERPIHNIAHNGNNPRPVTRKRRHLPRHVVAARLRVARWAALWVAIALTLGIYTGRSQVATARDGLIVGVAGASITVGVLYTGRRRRRR